MLDSLLNAIQHAEEHDDKQFVTALARGISLMAAFDQEMRPLTHQLLCEKSGLPKATVSRLLYTLMKLDFIRQQGHEYYLGANCFRLSHIAEEQRQFVQRCTPLMIELAQKQHISVSLATERNGKMYYLQSIRSPAKLTVQLSIGSEVPIESTAIGRAHFIHQTETEQQRILRHLQHEYPKQAAEFELIFAQAKLFFEQNAYTYSDGEFSNDITAIAVPVWDSFEKRYAYSLNASVPRAACNEKELVEKNLAPLQQLAKRLSKI